MIYLSLHVNGYVYVYSLLVSAVGAVEFARNKSAMPFMRLIRILGYKI